MSAASVSRIGLPLSTFRRRPAVPVGFDAVGDLQQQVGTLAGEVLPHLSARHGRRRAPVRCLLRRSGRLWYRLAGDRCDDVEIFALDWGDPLPPISCRSGFVRDLGAIGAGGCVNHCVSSMNTIERNILFAANTSYQVPCHHRRALGDDLISIFRASAGMYGCRMASVQCLTTEQLSQN